MKLLVRHAMHLAFVAMFVYFALATPNFVSVDNLLNIINQNFAYIILGTGMTVVIVAGGIDLSVGSLVALTGVVGTLLLRDAGIAFGVLGALAAGTAVGAISGVMVTRFRVPAFIATLAWFLTARGLAYKLCGAHPISDLPAAFLWLGQGKLGPLRLPTLIALVLAGVMHLVLTRSVFGRHVFAIGGNEEAAQLSGVPVVRNKIVVYAASGLLAGLCGILLAARLGAGDPKVGAQPPLELGAITAVVLGGASLQGGKGSIAGTLFGAIFMGMLDNGLALLGMQYFDQLIVKGLVLLMAVLFDQLSARYR